MSPDPIASPWVVFPIAAVLLIAVAGNIIALREAPRDSIPESRRRLRIATGIVIMFTIPLTAYGFGIANTADAPMFILIWTVIVSMLCGILVLAGADMLNSMRLHQQDRERLDSEYRKLLDEQGPGADDE